MDERQLQEEQIKKKMLDILHKQEKTKMEYQKKRNFKTSAAFNDDKDEEEEETVTMNPQKFKTSAAFNEALDLETDRLVNYFAAEFGRTHRMDMRSNERAMRRLRHHRGCF